jgi:hypothetical protein
MKTIKNITIPSILLAVAVLATGCHKAESTDAGMGPAQAAGKAVDDTGAKVAAESKEAADRANAAAARAGDKVDAAAERAGDKMQQAGAEVRQESHEAAQNMKEGAQNVKEGAKDATAAAGRGIERTGERMQEASK